MQKNLPGRMRRPEGGLFSLPSLSDLHGRLFPFAKPCRFNLCLLSQKGLAQMLRSSRQPMLYENADTLGASVMRMRGACLHEIEYAGRSALVVATNFLQKVHACAGPLGQWPTYTQQVHENKSYLTTDCPISPKYQQTCIPPIASSSSKRGR